MHSIFCAKSFVRFENRGCMVFRTINRTVQYLIEISYQSSSTYLITSGVVIVIIGENGDANQYFPVVESCSAFVTTLPF